MMFEALPDIRPCRHPQLLGSSELCGAICSFMVELAYRSVTQCIRMLSKWSQEGTGVTAAPSCLTNDSGGVYGPGEVLNDAPGTSVLLLLGMSLLAEQRAVRFHTLSLYADSSLLALRPITVVSSAKLMTVFVEEGIQERAQHTSLWNTSVLVAGGGCMPPNLTV